MRFSIDEVDGERQGATYPFSATTWKNDSDTFLGPIAINVNPQGDIYVGGMHDSGWHGGLNTGEIVRLRRNRDPLPLGIREIRATPSGFEISFTAPVDPKAAASPANYAISGYTRRWKGTTRLPTSTASRRRSRRRPSRRMAAPSAWRSPTSRRSSSTSSTSSRSAPPVKSSSRRRRPTPSIVPRE